MLWRFADQNPNLIYIWNWPAKDFQKGIYMNLLDPYIKKPGFPLNMQFIFSDLSLWQLSS